MKRTCVIVLLCLCAASSQAKEKITLFAAASLTNAIEQITHQYQKENNVEIVTSFASSSTLARQIEQGAPVDIFISADQKWMNYLEDRHEIDKITRVTLLGNDLVLIAPKSSSLHMITIGKNTDWLVLLKGGRLAVGDPDHVPAGIYAKEALTFLGAYQQLEPLLARASDVRGALMLVEKEESPLGIVYGSDAIASKNSKVIGIFPNGSHKPVEYPMAIIKDHTSPSVIDFYHYLKTNTAAEVFKQQGFNPR